MFKILIINLTLYFFINGSASKNINSTHQKIVGGSGTTIQRHPWQVAVLVRIQSVDHFICGGSILSPDYVLTAAHCLDLDFPYPVTFIVKFGVTYQNEKGEIRRARPIIHPKYDRERVRNDIGVLALRKEIKLDGLRTKAINLPGKDEIVPDNQRVVVTGWGLLSEGGPISNRLQQVTVPIVNFMRCHRWYSMIGSQLSEDMICAGRRIGGKDSCQGDSGGPLVIRRGQIQVGVVSWGRGCARPMLPGVYANVAYFRDWINRTTGL